MIEPITYDYPAVELSISGKICEWEALGNGKFRCDDIFMQVTIEPYHNFNRKIVEITSETEYPTPDYLIIDRQTVNDPDLKMRGYVASCSQMSMELSDEEGGGVMPGCGYPLIGKRCFAALEHQAGFNIIRKQDQFSTVYELRQHPVWEK